MSNKNPELDQIDFEDDLINMAPLQVEEPEAKVQEEKKENEVAVNTKPEAGSGGPEIAPVETQDERDKRSVFVKNVHYSST